MLQEIAKKIEDSINNIVPSLNETVNGKMQECETALVNGLNQVHDSITQATTTCIECNDNQVESCGTGKLDSYIPYDGKLAETEQRSTDYIECDCTVQEPKKVNLSKD